MYFMEVGEQLSTAHDVAMCLGIENVGARRWKQASGLLYCTRILNDPVADQASCGGAVPLYLASSA